MHSSRITRSAKGQPCIKCGKLCPTVSARHFNGDRQHAYGKGRGIKCSDLASAELCDECEAPFSEGQNDLFDGVVARSEEFLHLCMMTNISRFERGVLTDGSKPRKAMGPDTTSEWEKRLGVKAA